MYIVSSLLKVVLSVSLHVVVVVAVVAVGWITVATSLYLATEIAYYSEPLLESTEEAELASKEQLKKLGISETDSLKIEVSFDQTEKTLGCLTCANWTPGNTKEFKMNLSNKTKSSMRHESYHIYRIIKLGAPHISSYGFRYFLIEEPLAMAYALTKRDLTFSNGRN